MKLKFITILSILVISFTVSADGGHGHEEPPSSTVSADLFDATLASLETFKSDNPKLVSDYGAIRVRMGKEKGVETQIKTKNNGLFTFKCHRHESSEPFECHEAEIKL